MIDEAWKNTKKVTSTIEDDNDELLPTLNHNDIEEETNEVAEEDTSDK